MGENPQIVTGGTRGSYEKSSLKRRGMLSSGVKAADLGFEGKDLA